MTKGRRGWNLTGPAKPVLRGEEHYAWKGDEANEGSKHDRARRLYAVGACERCGAAKAERHHRDGDSGNNAPANIATLCRRCHMEVDGRLEQVTERMKATKGAELKPAQPCANCGRPYKPLRRGRCAACDVYLRRRGTERPNAR